MALITLLDAQLAFGHVPLLDHADFSLESQERVGLIGRNGAGKSTLLQLVCGTLNPSSGSVAVNGKIGALLELGAGFNPEFTGRENIYLNAAILGLSKQDQIEIISRTFLQYWKGVYVKITKLIEIFHKLSPLQCQ